MGLEKAKSLLPVKEKKTFLDLIAEQVLLCSSHGHSQSIHLDFRCYQRVLSASTWLCKRFTCGVPLQDVPVKQVF